MRSRLFFETPPRRPLLLFPLHQVEHLLAARRVYRAHPEGGDLRLCERAGYRILCAAPIVVQGDVEGGVLLPGSDKAPPAAPEAAAAVSTAAAFLAKCLE